MHGRQNPVDASTRGVFDPAKFLDQEKYGKSWLHGPENSWKTEIKLFP